MDIDQRDEKNDLGKFIKEFQVEPLWKNYFSVMAIIIPLTFVISLGKLGSSTSDLYTVVLITIGVFFLGTLLVFITYILNRNKRLLLYEKGFIYSNQNSQIIRYEDITAVWEEITTNKLNGIKVSTNYRYTILAKNQLKSLVLDNNFPDIQEAFEYIRANVIKYQLPIAIERYNRDESISFGVLIINQDGLKIRDKKLAWEEIKGIKIVSGLLVIKFNKNQEWFEPVSKIPNWFIFLMLIHEILDEKISSNSTNQGEDLHCNLKILPEEAISGCDKEIKISRLELCDECYGAGVDSSGDVCPVCIGEKRNQVIKTLKINIPVNSQSGEDLKIVGEGNAGLNGGSNGDLYIHLIVSE